MKNNGTTKIKITGFGGQGVILAGILIGKAASLIEDKNAVLVQNFGPEARGGAAAASLIVSEHPIQYPYIKTPNILIALSQAACDKYLPELSQNGILIYEKDLVNLEASEAGLENYLKDIKRFSIPSTRIAEKLGQRIVQNIVTLGFFTAISGLIKPESIKTAIKETVPKGTIDLNLHAFDKGFSYLNNGTSTN